MKKNLSVLTRTKFMRTGISFLLAVIDIALVAQLKQGGNVVLKAAGLIAGVILFTVLTERLFRQRERRLIVHAGLWGLLMSAAYVAGCLMRRDGTLFDGIGSLPGALFSMLCLAVPAASCVALILQGFPRLRKLCGRERIGGREYPGWQVGLFYFLCILVCWIPVFLAYYPSVFAYDAEGQLYQVIAGDYSTHHPLLHTLFLGAFFKLGGRLGSYSLGMAFHSVAQMLLMAGAFGYVLSCLYRRRTSVYLRLFLAAFYGLFPTNSILAISTTKDVLFSALVLLYVVNLYQRICGGKRRKDMPVGWCAYVITAVLMLLMRNNALYAFAVSIPLVCLGLHHLEQREGGALWKQYLLFSLTALLLAMAGNAGLKAVVHARNGSPREMLSVPLQQMARTRVKEEENLPPEIREELDAYLSSEWVFAAYNPHLADPVKQRAVIHDNPAGFLRTWVKLGLKYPQIYVDAFLDNTIGYWFLEDTTHAEIYGVGTESGFGYLSTDNRAMPAGCEIVEHSYLPGLRAFMEEIVSKNAYQKIPVLRIVFAPAFYWWLLCLYIAAAVYRRKYRHVLPAIFLVVYYMTLLLSPTVLIRYMYPFVVTAPVLCCLICRDMEEEKEGSGSAS
ncbi:MAG: hypothetical protein J6A08_10810 [Lachnospiraceae bacterium]|nr:hypothetical protein [Lachnospiraceae bacterium]